MKIAIIGADGRAHTTLWKMAQRGNHEFFWLGKENAGMADIATHIPADITKPEELCEIGRRLKPDLTFVSPEIPLVKGIGDRFRAMNLPIVGPDQEAAKLEGSKIHAKRFMAKHGIPTASPFRFFGHPNWAKAYIRILKEPPVVKADEVCAGKGVFVPDTHEEALAAIDYLMVDKKIPGAGNNIVIEPRLRGTECSFIVLTDGENIVPFVTAVDYKRRYPGTHVGKNPNTGGMGSYGPNPRITPELLEEIMERIVRPTIRGMAGDGTPFRGILYFGLMITDFRIYVLEFNVRMGDPECQVILPLLESDLVELFLAAATRELQGIKLVWKPLKAVNVVLVSKDYPEKPLEASEEIIGIKQAEAMGALVFQANTVRIGERVFTPNGGRVLSVTGRGQNFAEARMLTYQAAELIQFPSKACREDIALRLD